MTREAAYRSKMIVLSIGEYVLCNVEKRKFYVWAVVDVASVLGLC